MEKGGSRLMQMQKESKDKLEALPFLVMQTRNLYRSLDHVNWWEPDHWKAKKPRSLSSVSLEGADPAEIRNGWLTLPQDKARFQQKQMQEREMKIANLYEAQQARALDRVRQSPSNLRHSPSNGVNGSNGAISSPPQPVSHQPGKVRQMFEERRTKAGIDKSYPLQPIHNTERRKALPNGYSKVTATSHATKASERTTKTRVTQHTVKKVHHKTEIIVNGSGDLNHNHELDLNSLRHALPQSNGEPITDETDGNENYLLEHETFPDALAPATTPREPDPVVPKQDIKPPPRRAPAARTSPPKSKPPSHAATPPRRVISENAVTDTTRARGAMQTGASPAPAAPRRQALSSGRNSAGSSAKARPGSAGGGAGGAGGEPCSVCGRRFAADRLAKHEDICRKAHAKKRKPFDVLKHRLAGTEAEPFISKLRKSSTNQSAAKVGKPAAGSWRQKHEEFIQAIRAAKQVQAHLASGGKLSDLPPPPPSENPDYVACPHCGRRFNQGAAERHIPKCKNYQFNKPKPAPKRR